MEDPSHGFFINRLFIHNWFVGLDNPLKAIVHHLIIEGMTDLGYQEYGECTSVYGSTLDRTYNESWLMVIK